MAAFLRNPCVFFLMWSCDPGINYLPIQPISYPKPFTSTRCEYLCLCSWPKPAAHPSCEHFLEHSECPSSAILNPWGWLAYRYRGTERKFYSQLPSVGLVLTHGYALAHVRWTLHESSLAHMASFLCEDDLSWSWILVCSVSFTGELGAGDVCPSTVHIWPRLLVTSPVRLSETWRFLMLVPPPGAIFASYSSHG